MVALNPAYASSESIDAPQNRVGDFFCRSSDRVGVNRLSIQQPRLESELTFTITASGRPFFINADPIGFAGGMNWYAYAGGNPVMFVDPNGEIAVLAAIAIVYWGITQYANAPAPGAQTYNGAPFADEASLLIGAGPANLAGRSILKASAPVLGNAATRSAFTYGAGSSLAMNSARTVLSHAVTNPNIDRTVGSGLVGLGVLGGVNEITNTFDTGGFSGVDFAAGGPIGGALGTGINAFDIGGNIVKGGRAAFEFAQNTAIPAANNFLNSFGSSPASSSSITYDPFSSFNPPK